VSDLVELARRYVTLSDELANVRGEIAKAVLNGGGGNEPARPTSPARQASGGHPNAKVAQQAEAKIIEVLRSSPGLKTTEIAKAMDSKLNTTTQRLSRMRDRGEIIRSDDGNGWQAAAPA
jgi:hypothetical protein